ncbi:uncharacterized protein LOC129599721 [Paramacrobiotus metropolitanus]|uniref:uncharacterized protein LOC129599721 n=1 Tax=Paramacrobiotus metropolitanus TaxID=2943436 RepID=UPI002445DC54|nr:uncharacterized protein LOC129599721 [Paramacrobiotus metropolitanus]
MRYLIGAIRSSGMPQHEQSLYWATFTLMYFGFLRVGEVTCPGTNSYDPRRTLMSTDVQDHEDRVLIQLKVTKTDPTGQGHSVALTATGRSVCPVQAYRKYLAHAQFIPTARARPCLIHQDGRYLTRRSVKACLHRLLEGHPDQLRINTHSFRIGAATTAARNNVPDRVIQRAGRWKSNCYVRYIRTPAPTTLNPYSNG